MGWTAEDCAILLQAMAGHDPADPASANRRIPDYRAALPGGVKGLRIGLVRHFHERDHEANPATREAIAPAPQTLEGLRCPGREITLSPPFKIVGKRCDDATVLRLAHAYEQATPWRERRPQL